MATKKTDYKKLYNYIFKQASRDDLSDAKKQRYLYMLQKIDEYTAKGVDFNTAVRKAYSGANISYAMERQKQAEAAGDTGLVSFFKKMRGHALTKTQEGEDIAYTKGRPTSSKVKKPSFRTIAEIAGKGTQLKFFQILIYIIAAACSIIIPPFFGIPPRTYLAIGFVFIAIHSVFPSERSIVSEVGRGEQISGGAMGFLTVKAFAKLVAFFFILLDFFTLNRMLALVFGFIFYFNLPFRYKTSQPYKLILAWVRLVLGIYLAFQISSTFAGPLSWPLGLMSAAFFIAIPTHIEEEGGVITINLSLSKKGRAAESLIFSLVMIGALFTFFQPFGPFAFDISDVNVVLFSVVWFFSLFSGATAGPEARPAVGVIVILISLFIFSTTYTGFVGSAIFGVWWPQVQGFGETYLSPLNVLLAQAQSGLSDSWLLLTNPQQYYLLQQQKIQVAKSIPTGTILSLEFTGFDIYTSIPGTLEPSEPTIGFIELTNKGEYQSDPSVFGASTLEIYATWTDPVTAKISDVGSITEIECGRGSGSGSTCTWSDVTYPSEIEVASFIYKEDSWTNGTLDLGGQCLDVDGNPAPCVPGTTYTYATTLFKVNANLTYNYKVNVSIPIDVMDTGLYMDLLKNKQIVIKELTSYYTGGPVKATLISRKQPLRSDETNIVIASLLNEGTGIIKQAKFVIKVPDNLIDNLSNSDLYYSFDSCEVTNPSGFYVITCTHGRDIESQEFKRVSFFIKPDALPADVDSKTSLIVGLTDYRYLNTQSRSLQLAIAPPQ
ncbi:MAG: hypothetical protein GTN40_00770 [Candidatus Aenigmarchaeota archaeon]|nr:hypothetical protein [Candidatus Aenigmarchaeota archaeon]